MSPRDVQVPPLSLATPAGRFRLAAIAEAWSWGGLLLGMAFKYLVVRDPIGVQIMGPIHGVLFIAYVISIAQVRGPMRWDARTTALALLASLPPFCTVWFERWALRSGRLRMEESGAR